MIQPKGYLVCIGGAEDKGDASGKDRHELDFEKGILKNIVKLLRSPSPIIEIITTATAHPEEYFQQYKKAFEKLGCTQVGHIRITDREGAANETYLKRIRVADGVLFTGGDQLRLCSILGGTELFEVLRKRYQEDHFVIAGTSAGAAAMSNTMICGGSAERAYLKGTVQLSIGFGFLNQVIIDTHFDKRGRFGRLSQAIAAQPGAIGIGLGEDSGVIVEGGSRFRAIGSSSVIVVDGHDMEYNNIADLRDGMPISISNLRVHIMAHSDIYELGARSFTGVRFSHHVS
jgi:cyanophycinase